MSPYKGEAPASERGRDVVMKAKAVTKGMCSEEGKRSWKRQGNRLCPRGPGRGRQACWRLDLTWCYWNSPAEVLTPDLQNGILFGDRVFKGVVRSNEVMWVETRTRRACREGRPYEESRGWWPPQAKDRSFKETTLLTPSSCPSGRQTCETFVSVGQAACSVVLCCGSPGRLAQWSD